MFPQDDSASIGSPVADQAEKGPHLSGKGNNLAPSTRVVEPMAPQRESCDIASILPFLQELLGTGFTPSILEVYVAAITANCILTASKLEGNDLIAKFLRGARSSLAQYE